MLRMSFVVSCKLKKCEKHTQAPKVSKTNQMSHKQVNMKRPILNHFCKQFFGTFHKFGFLCAAQQ